MATKARLTARIRHLVAICLIIGAFYAGWTHRQEIHAGLDGLDHPGWLWLFAACAVQASSMFFFARLQRWLLRCGGVDVRLRAMVEITLAGNALSMSLPGGAAWSAGWMWGQLRRRNVDRVLAGWAVLVAGALSSFALFLLVVVGAEIAGSVGPVASLRWVERVLLFLAVLAGGCLVALARSGRLQQRWAGLVDRAHGGSGIRAKGIRGLDYFGHEVRIVTPSPMEWGEAMLLALANWGADLATLVFCVWTVHASVPWRGIVVCYALTQISASIPITPGGLAVVEASLGALLVGYGMPSTTAVTVVLLYRLISFWCLVPIGWGAWGILELQQRGSTTRHHPWAWRRHASDGRAAGPERHGSERHGSERHGSERHGSERHGSDGEAPAEPASSGHRPDTGDLDSVPAGGESQWAPGAGAAEDQWAAGGKGADPQWGAGDEEADLAEQTLAPGPAQPDGRPGPAPVAPGERGRGT